MVWIFKAFYIFLIITIDSPDNSFLCFLYKRVHLGMDSKI